MVEFFKHLFGCCGESHPSLLYLTGIMPFLLILRFKIAKGYKLITLSLKKFLGR